MNPHDVH